MKKRRKKGRVKEFENRSGNVRVDDDFDETFAADEEETPVKKNEVRRRKKKFKFNRVRAMVTVIVVTLVAVVGVSLKNVISLHIEQNQLIEENEQLKSDKASLTDELKNVNDKSYIEEQARIQLRLIKPGEILYILGGDDENSDDSKEDDGEASN